MNKMKGGIYIKFAKIIAFLLVISIISGCLCVYADELPMKIENSWRYLNGNEVTNSEITLSTVIEPWSKQGSYFVNNNGVRIEGATLKGIDVSHHQGNIDWEKVNATDIDFAIIRCGYGDDYVQYDDKLWYDNANACTELEIPFGVYIYSYAKSIEEAKSEAYHVLRLVEGYDLSYPIYLDLEDNKTVATCSNELIAQMARTFCDIVQEAGYNVGIYANKNWWDNRLTDSTFSNNSWYKWVAQYNSTCTYTGSYTMWQATSLGTVNGISGNVDINFWFGNAPNTGNLDYSYPNTYINTGNLKDDIVGVAQTQIGYTELSDEGIPVVDSQTPHFTKYGAYYGNAYGHWCSFFVMWCAEQAQIPTSIICNSASCGNCGYFTQWFKSNNRWRDNSYYPQKGDIIFFDWDDNGDANHVGIVVETDGDTVVTIEGNTGGENGYLVAVRNRDENILGYGVPDYSLINKLNGLSIVKQTAYMLPDIQSSTVWETWKNDELQVLCEDGDYYLVLYPYVYTGKFVAAYVPKKTVSLKTNVPLADEFYSINKQGKVINNTTVYHNASADDLISGENNYKIRTALATNDIISVLFEDNEFYFIRTDEISGYVLKTDVSLENDTETILFGDVNNDFKVNSADAGLILRYDAGLINLTLKQLQIADVNNDFKVDSADAGLILRYDAGIIQKFN